MAFSGTFDSSFARHVLGYLDDQSSKNFKRIVDHTAAESVHYHAVRFDNTSEDCEGFWQTILNDILKEKVDVRGRIEGSMEYLLNNRNVLNSLLEQTGDFLPTDINLDFKIYGMVGYDIGIVSRGDAFLNLAAKHFAEDQRELLYFAMHESHHVGYTHYNPIYALSDLKTKTDLLSIIRYSTHLEGLATYAPLKIRRQENGTAHEDYKVLFNPSERRNRCSTFFTLISRIENSQERELDDSDYEIIDRMSGRNERLWYIAGAEMCRTIDEELGRKRLRQTVKNGPLDFFNAYHESS